MERIVLIQKEDRGAFIREVETAKAVEISSEQPVSVISVILRKLKEATTDAYFASAVARSLRLFGIHAILPVEESLLIIVDETDAVTAMKKLHHDLFEV